jgi:AraC-like DNA-binding protein
MLFNFEVKSALLLLCFLHGCLFTILLAVKSQRDDDPAAGWLSLFSALAALYIAPFMLGYAGWYGAPGYRQVLFYVPFQQLLALPPVLYFYFRALLDRSFRFQAFHALHLVPATLYLLYTLFMWLADAWLLPRPHYYADGRDRDFDAWYQLAGFGWLLAYLLACIRLYRRYRTATRQQLSYADAVRMSWAGRFLYALCLLLALRLAFFVLNPEWGQFGRKFWYYGCFGVLLYYISLSGYLNTIRTAVALPPAPPLPAPRLAASNTEAVPAVLPADLDQWKTALEQLMNQRQPYTNATLTVQDLADELGLHPKKLSALINAGYGQNFNDYINQYRTKAVLAKMAAGEHNLQTLMGLAYDAGFNSKSTFNRAFLRVTGTTPRAYLEKNHPKSSVKS